MEELNLNNLIQDDIPAAQPLPQSEAEWLETGKFKVEMVQINDNQIRCAITGGAAEGTSLVAMVGGIPRDPERRKKLPLINKLYGNLAVKSIDQNISSLLYNQPATGGSSGDWEKETMKSRAEILTGLTEHFYKKLSCSDICLVGMSAGSYMAVDAASQIQNKGFNIPKLILMSPAAYPKEVENIPYSNEFTETLRKPWNVSESPVFPKLEKYVKDGGIVLISFFEADDPPIPKFIQDQYKTIAKRLSDEGGNIKVVLIPGVAHNFRRIGVSEGQNVVDNESIRASTSFLLDFLKERF